jgi:hypothetical protein
VKLVFRAHAIRRMFQGGITADAVRQVIMSGSTIEARPDDRPLPSRLVLGWIDGRPVDIVVADDVASATVVVVTVYEPDLTLWRAGFRRRRRQ